MQRWKRERERENNRETDRQTGRQRDRHNFLWGDTGNLVKSFLYANGLWPISGGWRSVCFPCLHSFFERELNYIKSLLLLLVDVEHFLSKMRTGNMIGHFEGILQILIALYLYLKVCYKRADIIQVFFKNHYLMGAAGDYSWCCWALVPCTWESTQVSR